MFLEPVQDATPLQDTIVLQLETVTPMRTMSANKSREPLLQQVSMKQYWLQDETSRITILTSRQDVKLLALAVADNEQTVLKIVIPDPYVPLQLRFIMEDINTFYDAGRTEPQYFATTMINDWTMPIERFLVPPQKN